MIVILTLRNHGKTGKVFLLTYLFDGSETNAWLDLFSIPFVHKELRRRKGKLDLEAHDCSYSGREFKYLLNLVDEEINDIGNKGRAKGDPLTKTWFNGRSKAHEDLKILSNNTRTFYRNMKAVKEDMLWTCFKDYRDWIRDSRFDPKRGQQTWLQQSERGTNSYADRHYLAFLVNVFPPVELETFFGTHGVTFNKENYALSRVIQWTWRSAIRKLEAVTLYLPSGRMRELVIDWLD